MFAVTKELRKKYQETWKAKNPEKLKIAQEKYRISKLEKNNGRNKKCDVYCSNCHKKVEYELKTNGNSNNDNDKIIEKAFS